MQDLVDGSKGTGSRDISEFCAQLDALGLEIIQVTADGNCFFRSYHDGEHYNSVQLKEDTCIGPAWLITIKVSSMVYSCVPFYYVDT
ncbi:OVARIAN TUMOR DOMAIN-containing deubiquitinating enzyme 7-like [Actinidia eriantha]|uniref:OVARIAN TUMOR DOMAIN-containing deubiquitinating enzyme 7-like n=1 Tax=Actinidia eriantha TaxID=165200 RepID=UPI0025831BC0|nr:OVARIAN TUMOR DOMAIN-containing deubiquitinating enzyme 7-like [Actinidia eriantha]